MRHSFKEKKSLFSGRSDYWNYIETLETFFEPAKNSINTIRQITDVKTATGRGRAWIRFALIEKSLALYLQQLTSNEKWTREWYDRHAFLRNEEINVLIGLLIGMNALDFSLCLKNEDFDKQSDYIDFSLYLKDGKKELLPPSTSISPSSKELKQEVKRLRSRNKQLLEQIETLREQLHKPSNENYINVKKRENLRINLETITHETKSESLDSIKEDLRNSQKKTEQLENELNELTTSNAKIRKFFEDNQKRATTEIENLKNKLHEAELRVQQIQESTNLAQKNSKFEEQLQQIEAGNKKKIEEMKQVIKEYEEKIKSDEHLISQLRAEFEDKDNENKKLLTKIEDSAADRRRLEIELESKSKNESEQIVFYKNEIARLGQKIESTQQELDSNSSKLQETEKKLKETDLKLTDTKQTLQNTQEKLGQLVESHAIEINGLKAKFEEDMKQQQQKFNELRTKLEQEHETNTKLGADIVKLEDLLRKEREMNKQATSKVQLLEKTLQSEKSINSEQASRVSTLQEQLNLRNSEYQTGQEKLADNEKVITRLNTQIEEQHKMKIALEKEVNTYKQKAKAENDLIQNLKVERDESREHAEKLQERVDQNTKTISELEEKLKAAQAQIEEKNKETGQLNSQITQSKNEIKKVHLERSKSVTALKSTETEIEALKTKLQELETDRNSNKTKLEKSESDLKLTQNELIRITQEIEGRAAQELEDEKKGGWANDDEITNCTKCTQPFTVTKRRHHCRSCGKIFCNECSSRRAPLPTSPKPVRVCDNCYTNSSKPDWRRLSMASSSSSSSLMDQ